MQELYEEFENYIQKQAPKINSFHPFFETAAYEMVLSGGKRFRPKLFFAVVAAFEPLLLRSSFPVALAIEVFHTYSLIHDDLPCMDGATLRRGRPTLHIKYDEVSAVLAGDGLNTYAFYLLSKAPFSSDVRIALVEELAFNGGFGGMVIGQALDCYFEKQPLTREELEFLHTHKTGKLIASSLKMGAISVCADKKLQETLFDFGLKVGLLFQIKDDILDATQSEQEAGKNTQNDRDKNSYVNLLGLDGAINESKKLSANLLETLLGFPQNLKKTISPLLQNYL